jgi:hypothetical protein
LGDHPLESYGGLSDLRRTAAPKNEKVSLHPTGEFCLISSAGDMANHANSGIFGVVVHEICANAWQQ